MDHFILLGDMGSGEDDQYKVADAMHKKIKQLNKKDIFVCGGIIYEDGYLIRRTIKANSALKKV